MSSKYQEDGVNIEVGDDFSAICAKICRGSYGNSHFVDVIDMSKGNFRGPRGFNLKNLPEGYIKTLVVDGVGTKLVPIVASGKVKTAAHDVIAMTAMDITRYGGLPLVFVNIFVVSTLGETDSETYQLAIETMMGLGTVAKRHDYVVLGGETAELGPCVGSEDPNAVLKFNWGGTMFGVYHPDKMIYGDTLKPGQVIMALQDTFRSNGISSVRKALALKYGQEWYKNPEALADITAASVPSVQYDRFLNHLNGWFSEDFQAIIPMHLIVHLSGGAFQSKLGEDMLKPQGLSAMFDNLFEPANIMKKCATWRKMSDAECYQTWNGGQGALVVIDEDNINLFERMAHDYDIATRVAGRIIDKDPEFTVQIISQFTGEIINYE